MKVRVLACCIVAAALAASPAFAAGKKSAKAAAAKGTAVATVAAPVLPVPVPLSTINAPTCKRGDWVTINGKKMACQ